MIEPKPPVFFVEGMSMFMIREILGYCIISAVCLLGMAVFYAPICFLLRNRVPPTKQLAYFLFGACVIIVLAATVIVGASKTAAADRSLNLVPFQVFQEDRPNCRECRDVCPIGLYDASGLPENAQLLENRSFPGAVLLCH